MRQNYRLFLFLILLACGPVLPPPQKMTVSQKSEEVSQPTPSILEEQSPALESILDREIGYGLRILPEGNYSQSLHGYKMPDPNIDLKSAPLEAGVVVKNAQISFSKVILLPDYHSEDWTLRRELFFVWPETGASQTVIQSIVTHQILDGQNKIIGSLSPTVAWHDLERHRWFFPISLLFKDSKYNSNHPITEAETQIMTLELTMIDGTKTSYEVRFRAKGNIYETK